MIRNMRRGISGWLGICLLLLGGIGGTPLSAQSPAVPSDKLGWTQDATAAEIAQITFVALVDGARVSLPSATCSLNGMAYDCLAPVPPMTPGTHEIRVVAIRTVDDVAVESAASAPLSVELILVPAPRDLRITR